MPSHPGVKRQNILSPRGSGLQGFGVLQRETVSCGVLEAFFSRLLEESVECLGVVNLDSTVRSTKQALHSFQAG